MTCEEIADALAKVDPSSSDDGWTNCFFCLAMIESGHEQHDDDCLWVAARKLKGLPYAVQAPTREASPAGRPPIADTGSLRRSIIGMSGGLTVPEPKK